MRRAPVVLILLTVSVSFVAQEAKVQPAKSVDNTKPSVTAPAKPKLTEQQKRGLSLLETAEAGAGGLESTSRIVAYTQIARVYQTSNKNKAVDLLQQAYDTLRTLQLDSPNKGLNMQLKYQLQHQVLNQFASLAPGKVDGLMDQMEPTIRKQALQVLLPYYEKNNNLDRPVSVLMQLAVEAEMPYEIVNDVMDKLGPAHPDQIRELFLASLTSYQNHDHLEISPSTDFANLIAKAYGKVTNESVEAAIDELLSQAKKADDKNSNLSISMGFEKGAVEFKSSYDMQLFAVLPTLEQVDAEKAKRLLKEREDVRTFASKYPQGMNSLSENGRPRSIGINTGKSGGDMPPAHVLEEQQMIAITKDAADHPNDALANAAALKPQLAVMAYMNIAEANVKKNATAAATALGKAEELLTKIPVWDQMSTLTLIITLYEQLGDKESAQKAVDRGTKTLAIMYRQESDADDPNLAPRAYWVSTNAWQRLVELGYDLNPGQAATLVQEAPDDELRVFAQIELAKRMMGITSPAPMYSMTAHKNGMMMSMMPEQGKDESK